MIGQKIASLCTALLLSLGVIPVPATGQESRVIQLELALGDQDTSRFRVILDSTWSPPLSCVELSEVLLYAAGDCIYPATIMLLDRGADINTRGYAGWTPLMRVSAAEGGDDLLSELLRRGADPQLCGDAGVNALDRAAMYGSVKKMKALIKAGINPQQLDSLNQSPLFYAAVGNNAKAVNFLLSAGVGVDAKDTNGKTSLQRAWEMDGPKRGFKCSPTHYDYEEERAWGAPESFDALYKAGADAGRIDWRGLAPAIRLAELDNPDVFEFAIEHGATITGDSAKTYPLHIAARWNCVNVARLLVRKGAPVDQVDEWGDTPLNVAIRRGSTQVVEFLLDQGADVNFRVKRERKTPTTSLDRKNVTCNRSPLEWALCSTNDSIPLMVLDAGADVSLLKKSETGSFLCELVTMSRKEVLEKFLTKGADPNALYHYSALETALASSQIEIANLLRRYGASLDVHSPQFDNDHLSGLPLLHRAASTGDTAAINWLLKEGFDPNTLDESLQNAAFHAAYNNHPAALDALRRSGTDLRAPNKSQDTPLTVAARRRSEDAFNYLIDQHIYPDPNDSCAGTALWALCQSKAEWDSTSRSQWDTQLDRMGRALIKAGFWGRGSTIKESLASYAICASCPSMARVGLEQGDDPTMLDPKDGTTILHRIGRANGRGWMVDLLVHFGADPNARDKAGDTPLLFGLRYLDYELREISLFESLFSAGADMNALDSIGDNPIRIAVESSSPRMVEWLLKHGSKPDIPNRFNTRPLYYAVDSRMVETTRLLLEAGADPNAKFWRGNQSTYLCTAASESYFDIVRLLLKYGADPNEPDFKGSAPLHYAAASSWPNEGGWCVEDLLKAGANPKARNREGKTPLDIAKVRNIPSIVTPLLKAKR